MRTPPLDPLPSPMLSATLAAARAVALGYVDAVDPALREKLDLVVGGLVRLTV